MSTIYALSTVFGKSAVAVIRLSGPKSESVLQSLSRSKSPISERLAQLRTLRHPRTDEILDQALTIYSKGPRSFTGEDTCELQIHGGKAVINAVLQSIPECANDIRLARPGEFSKRAFLNGKLDLTQAEGLADLINAETEEQRKVAVKQADGALTRMYGAWRKQLIEMRSALEAVIDFGEDNDDVNDIVSTNALRNVDLLRIQIRDYLDSCLKGELLRSGVRVVIFGPPNAGKSSVLNLLAQRDASIVSPEAGTTRDVVESIVDIGGFPVVLSDTAGLRSGDAVGSIEQEGVRRARNRIVDADLRLCVLSKHEVNDTLLSELLPYIEDKNDHSKLLILLNKTDLDTSVNSGISRETLSKLTGVPNSSIQEVSCLTPSGLSIILSTLVAKLKELTTASNSETSDYQAYVGTNPRHRAQLRECLMHLDAFISHHTENSPDSIVFGAEELRYAADSLGRVTGKIDINEILGHIFASFCIGK